MLSVLNIITVNLHKNHGNLVVSFCTRGICRSEMSSNLTKMIKLAKSWSWGLNPNLQSSEASALSHSYEYQKEGHVGGMQSGKCLNVGGQNVREAAAGQQSQAGVRLGLIFKSC